MHEMMILLPPRLTLLLLRLPMRPALRPLRLLSNQTSKQHIMPGRRARVARALGVI